jgi:MHS family proline/betaine transporter-like MFS transporter
MATKTLRPSLVIFATLIGNTLEWFEYLSFAFLAPVFAVNFYSEKDSWHSLVYAMMGFSLGYLFRPVGAIIFGFVGDRYGRKMALILSIVLMSIPTLVIGFLPTYAQIGFAAVILLSTMRLIQGIATGGEFPCSMTFLVESAPPHYRTLYGSFAYVGMVLGVLIGGADYFILSHFFPDSIYTWGWRSVYIFGALLGFLALFLRSKLHETYPFQRLKETHEILKVPLINVLQKHKLGILKLFGLQLLQTIDFNLLVSFSIIYLTKFLHLSDIQAAKMNMTFLIALILTVPLAGWIAKFTGAKRIMTYSAWAHVLLALPLYWMLQIEALRIFSLIVLGILSGSYMGPSISFYCDMFPARVRLSGLALGYNLTVALGGGFSPVAALWVIHHTGFLIAPALFMVGGAICSLLFLRTMHHS